MQHKTWSQIIRATISLLFFSFSPFQLFNAHFVKIMYIDMEITTDDSYSEEKPQVSSWNKDTKVKKDPTYIRITSKKVIVLFSGYT